MKEENANNAKNTENKNKKGTDLVTQESIGAVCAVFTLFAFLILVTGGLIFGDLGTAIRSFLLGAFGYAAYLLLPALFLGSLSLFIGKRLFKRKRSALAVALFFVSLALLIHSAVTFSWGSDGYLSACFKAAASSPSKATPAGVVGALFVYPLKRLTTAVGAIIIFSLLVLVFGYFVLRLFTGGPLFGSTIAKKSSETRSKNASRQTANGAANQTLNQTAPSPELWQGYGEASANGAASAQTSAQNYPNAQAPASSYAQPYAQTSAESGQGVYNGYRDYREYGGGERAGNASDPSAPYTSGYNRNYAFGAAPEIRQRPGVTLSDSEGYGRPVQTDRSGAFSPFAASTWGNGAPRAEQKGVSDDPNDYASNRDFLFSHSPAENYRKNLIFDHNSNVNKKPAADPDQPRFNGEKSAFGNSYTSAYADSVNRSSETVRPEKIVKDGSSPSESAFSSYGRTAFNEPESAPSPERQSFGRDFLRNTDESRENRETRGVFDRSDPYAVRPAPAPFVSPAEPVAPTEPIAPVAPAVSESAPASPFVSTGMPEPDRGESRGEYRREEGAEPLRDFSRAAEAEENRSSLDFRNLFSPSNPNIFGRSSEEPVRGRDSFFNDETSARDSAPSLDGRRIFDEEDEKPAPAEPIASADRYALRTEFPESRREDGEQEKETLRDEFRGDFTRDGGLDGGNASLGRSETSRGREFDRDGTRDSSRDVRDISRDSLRDPLRDADRLNQRERGVVNGERGRELPSEPVLRSEPPKPVEPPKPRVIRPYRAAPLDFFNCQDVIPDSNAQEVEENKRTILDTLEAFKVTDATIASVTYGPTVTRYNVAIPRNISPKKVVSLDQEIAMNLYAANGVNIYPNFEDGAVSIEVPNKKRQFVTLGCMIADERFLNSKPTALTFTMGKDVGNEKVYGDIRKMTHLLVAGASGSGKSVFLRALIISLLMRYSPADLRLILIDPKKTEFVIYDNLPHLVINEIITETNKVIQSLNWAIGEMNRRYGLFEQKSRAGTYVVNIDEYNANLASGEEKLPKIVIIVDELADLMLAAKKDIEDRIQNLTQKSRAAGIHMIIATQRPSADVITGVIKSNLKTRIAFSVASDVDSRVILDASGAQKLLGYGDMLYTKEGTNTPIRVQSPNIESEDAQKVVNYIKANNDCVYDESISAYINNTKSPADSSDSDSDDGGVEEVYVEALRYIVLSGSASISMIQRKCSVGYNKAGKIIEWMEDMGYISAFDGAKARKVLLTKEEFEEKYGPL